MLAGLLAAGALLLAPAASAQDPDFNAKCGALDCRVERVPAQWQLLAVGANGDRLKLVYESGGCRRGDGRATVTESAARIRIAVDEGEVVAIDTPDRQVICTADVRYRVLDVRLKRAVAGRPIVGGPRVTGGSFNRRVIPLVPRVIDLSARDATRVLRSQGFDVRRFGKRTGRVAFQSPRPGRRAPGGRVGITVGLRAFRARSLEACVEAAGIPTTAVRPRWGDEDAPDLELLLGGRDAPAFVALYADPARARELAPAIRRRARRGGAVVERAGRVTIVWVERPDAALREGARACLAGARP